MYFSYCSHTSLHTHTSTGARRQDPHMVPHVVVPPTNLFSFIFLFLIYFAWKIYGNTDKQVSDTSGSTVFVSIPYIFQAKYIRNKKNKRK